MAFVLIDSSNLKPALDGFCKLLAALTGPQGHLCLLVSPVDSFTLTSSSCRIIANLPIGSPILQFALQCIKSQIDRYRDNGLYCGILLSKLMIHLIDCSFPVPASCSILATLGLYLQSELQNSAELRLKVNLDSVQPFVSIAKSILFSKCSVFEGKGGESIALANKQATLLVRAFLHAEANVGNVLLSINDKCNHQCLLPGVLYPCTDGEQVVLAGGSWRSVPILLFSVMLTDRLDCNEKEIPGVELVDRGKAHLEAAEMFIDKAVSSGIRIIACQKVVHPSLLLKLKRKGVLVLQRLGKQMTNSLEMISGATRVSSLNTSFIESLSKLKGCLENVQQFEETDGEFILLEGPSNSGICSLLLTSRALGQGAELKAVAQQVLAALNQVLQDAVVLPGAGCTEVYLCSFLSQQVQQHREKICAREKCSVLHINTVLKWLQEGLMLSSGLNCSSGNLSVDSVYHHAWKGSGEINSIVDTCKCNCGLISSVDIKNSNGAWTIVSLNQSGPVFSDSHSHAQAQPFTPSPSGLCDVVLDVCSTKKSAIAIALDGCIAISNIGAIVTKS
ncbi:McKusick-Kaufman/Bardet-Biedl syndromes putative chaperonin-like [Thrips palmi]|uniref:McKusick-Kaufman/Bardet-Biedl syndromes putative chaperonin-like n=1 Tax=Thrips palmi TaxID=161013 RepID=A0A6P8ZWX6_THRPL|nr:McKusick-Kaufman/Bardet-Biedl syndromes putative chaperonin-like [Thrips palmi]